MGAVELAAETYDLLETRFWEPEAQLYSDLIAAGDWDAVDPYRGQNANMHMCEAMLSAFEATGESRYLDRAHLLARRICVDLADKAGGLVWEHYRTDWTHDWDYNKDDPQNLFKPYGYLPGHFTEWAKLLLILERYRPEDWMLPRARHLFDVALEKSWDNESGGMHYTFTPDGAVLDRDRYYWVLSETFAATAALALRTGDDSYWDWYDKAWAYSDKHFVDHEHGGWYRILDADNQKYDDLKSPPSKTDYHPLGACYETLEAMRLAGAVIIAGTKTPEIEVERLKHFLRRNIVQDLDRARPCHPRDANAVCSLALVADSMPSAADAGIGQSLHCPAVPHCPLTSYSANSRAYNAKSNATCPLDQAAAEPALPFFLCLP